MQLAGDWEGGRVTKFVNHIDHVQWVSHRENIARNVEFLGIVFDCAFEGPVLRDELGFILYAAWESGLEVIAPMEQVTEFNRQFHDHLARHGEGIQSIVFGVTNIARHRERIVKLGLGASDLLGDDPNSPWAAKLDLKEFIVGQKVMATQLVFGEIEYSEGVVTVE
jgi:4-hydroxyphenylpyruvate dioxygenase-like putative hemolysin